MKTTTIGNKNARLDILRLRLQETNRWFRDALRAEQTEIAEDFRQQIETINEEIKKINQGRIDKPEPVALGMNTARFGLRSRR